MKPIAEFAKITDYGTKLSATCPLEVACREFTLDSGERFLWVSDKADLLPQRHDKVLLLAWGTETNTLKRVFVSYKTKNGIIKTVGMRKADKKLIEKL